MGIDNNKINIKKLKSSNKILSMVLESACCLIAMFLVFRFSIKEDVSLNIAYCVLIYMPISNIVKQFKIKETIQIKINHI